MPPRRARWHRLPRSRETTPPGPTTPRRRTASGRNTEDAMKNILVLGAGLVARPLLRYLLTRPDTRLLVASLDVTRARMLLGAHPRGRVVECDVQDLEETSKL